MSAETGEENQVLDCQEMQINLSHSQHSLKLDYLVDDKERLEIQMNELRHNNKLLRQINKTLDKNKDTNLQQVLRRNDQLQKALIHLSNQCCQLKTTIFLTNQVNLDNEKEQRQILKNYEAKILDLRKSMQAKQLTVQELEAKITDKDWNGINYGRMQIFQRAENFNKMVKELSNKNNLLIAQNNKMKIQNKKMAEKIQKIQRLLACQCSYMEYKSLITSIGHKSTPKSKIHIESTHKQRRYNPESTCEQKQTKHKLISSQSSYAGQIMERQGQKGSQDALLRSIAKKKCQEATKLKLKVINQNYHIEKLTELNQILMQSNKIYQNSQKKQKERARQYESTFKYLFDYFTQRNPKFSSFKQPVDDLFKQSYLHDKSVKKLENSAKVYINSFQDWMEIKNTLDYKLSHARFQKKLTVKRSYSCLIDYIRNKQIHPKKPTKKRKQTQEEFSLMLQECNIAQTSIRVGGGKSSKQLIKGKKDVPEQQVLEFLDVFDNIL